MEMHTADVCRLATVRPAEACRHGACARAPQTGWVFGQSSAARPLDVGVNGLHVNYSIGVTHGNPKWTLSKLSYRYPANSIPGSL